MKQIVALAILMTLTCGLLVGCGPAAATDTADTTVEAAAEAATVSADGGAEGPGDAEGPEGRGGVTRAMSPADVQGVVSQVVGNEITLKLIEPQETFVIGGVLEDGTLPEGVSLPEGFTRPEGGVFEYDPENPPEGFSIPENFSMPEGARVFEGGTRSGGTGPREGGGNALRGSFAAGGLADMEREVTYTGEEMTVTLPVGLDISAGMGSIGSTDLSRRQILSIWYDEENPDKIVRAAVTGKAAS